MYGEGRPPERPLIVGSVKTNIGHLETAAGVAGLIKAVLALQHGTIPPQLHFEAPNAHIPWADIAVTIPVQPTLWDAGRGRRLAAVSSFGFSGTNAHIVLEEAPGVPQTATAAARADGPWIVPLSARSEEALRARAVSLRQYLAAGDPDRSPAVRDVGYTAALRRTHHEHRLAVIGRTREQVVERLDAYARGVESALVVSGHKPSGHKPKMAFVFSGQGSQWSGMGRTLAQEPVFRDALERCDRLFRRHAPWSILDEIALPAEQSRLGETEIAQPAIFAIQVALAALWRWWGMEPDAVVGHSTGEVAAAHIAGVLDLETAVAVAFHRGRLMQRATGLGRMLAVAMSEADAERGIEPYNGRIAVAAVNSPMSCALSGDEEALAELAGSLRQRGVQCRDLNVNYAFHGPQMAPIEGELLDAMRGIRTAPPAIPIVSTVTGRLAGETDFAAEVLVAERPAARALFRGR